MNRAAPIQSGETTNHLYVSNSYSKWKSYGFAIAIIVGIGGLIVGGVGYTAHLGTALNLNQVQAISMMAAGGGGGLILFIIGVVGSIKNRDNNPYESGRHSYSPTRHELLQMDEASFDKEEIIAKTNTQNGLRYGADAWRIWGIEVLDAVPPAPDINWDGIDPYFHKPYRENYVLIYIPQSVSIRRKEKPFTLNNLLRIRNPKTFNTLRLNSPIEYYNPSVTQQFGNSTSHGWALVSKKAIPESRGKDYETQKEMVEVQEGFRIAGTLEALTLNLMLLAFTDELSPTLCVEQVEGKGPIIILGNIHDGISIGFMEDFHEDYYSYSLDDLGVSALL